MTRRPNTFDVLFLQTNILKNFKKFCIEYVPLEIVANRIPDLY